MIQASPNHSSNNTNMIRQQSFFSESTTSKLTQIQMKELFIKYNNSQKIQACLKSIDIFQRYMQDECNPQQRTKIIRDVRKVLYYKCYEPHQIIVPIDKQNEQIFLVLGGKVVVEVPVQIKLQKSQDNEQQSRIEYVQIEQFNEGFSFNEKNLRGQKYKFVRTINGESQCIIGHLSMKYFKQVIENYNQRIYYKKRDLFQRSNLLRNVDTSQFNYIINNTYPVQFKLGDCIVKQGQIPKYLYLIMEGSVGIRKEFTIPNKKYRNIKNKSFHPAPIPLMNSSQSKQTKYLTLLNSNQFIGDMQFVCNTCFKYQAICLTQKVKLYACNVNFLKLQLTEDNIARAKLFYDSKHQILHQRAQFLAKYSDPYYLQLQEQQKQYWTDKQKKLKEVIKRNIQINNQQRMKKYLENQQIKNKSNKKSDRLALPTISRLKNFSRRDSSKNSIQKRLNQLISQRKRCKTLQNQISNISLSVKKSNSNMNINFKIPKLPQRKNSSRYITDLKTNLHTQRTQNTAQNSLLMNY